MPELITTSQDQYESLAIELALNSEKLDGIKKKLIKNVETSPLFDSETFTNNLELAFEEMHHRSQSGLKPDHIVVHDLMDT